MRTVPLALRLTQETISLPGGLADHRDRGAPRHRQAAKGRKDNHFTAGWEGDVARLVFPGRPTTVERYNEFDPVDDRTG
jgi:hypothetical protein